VQRVFATTPSWLPPVAAARRHLLQALVRLDGQLTGANRALHVLLPMLGASGPQRYFIGFLNESEARGVGGIPGAYAVATVDDGHVRFETFGTDDMLHGVRADVRLGDDFDARYRADDPTGVIQNSDLAPDFRYAAQIWAGMWQKKTGEHIAGAIAVDPTALSYLLRVTGPAELADGTHIGAANVVALTQQQQYTRFAATGRKDKVARKRYLVSIAKAVSRRLTHGGDVHRLAEAVARAAQQRRFVVWSAHPRIEEQLRVAGWAGAFDARDGSLVSGFVVNNAAATKLDYYLRRTITYRRVDCTAGGYASATLTLDNAAPTRGLPAYVTDRGDSPPHRARPGDNLVLVSYYAARGAKFVKVELDGRSVPVAPQPEGDLVSATIRVELPTGTPRTVGIVVAEPADYAPLRILRQPLVRPLTVHNHNKCGAPALLLGG
jgi:hypothetical protein